MSFTMSRSLEKISLDTDHGMFEVDAKSSDDPLEDSTELNPVPLDKRKKKQKGMRYKKGHVPEDDVSDDMPSMLPVIYLNPSTPNELQAVHEPKHGKVNVQEAVAGVDTDADWSNTPLRYLRPSGHDQTEPIDEVIEEERAAPSSKKDKKKSKTEKMRMSTEVPVDYGSMQIKVIRTVRGDWGEEK
jgi:hypothetical protein